MFGVASRVNAAISASVTSGLQEFPVAQHGVPERRQEDGRREQREPVEHDRRPLGVGVPDGLGDEPGRERQERDDHQEQDVERMTFWSAYRIRRNRPWWAIQMPPIVRKLVT